MKKAISATIEEKLIKWIDKYIDENPIFRNKSHLIETALLKIQKEQKK